MPCPKMFCLYFIFYMHILLVYNILFLILKYTVLWISGILGISIRNLATTLIKILPVRVLLSVNSAILKSMLFTLDVKFDVIFASSNSITAKDWFLSAGILSLRWSRVSELFESNLLRWLAPEPTALGWHARCQNIPFINNSMLCMPPSRGHLINFLQHGWILQCHDGSQLFLHSYFLWCRVLSAVL